MNPDLDFYPMPSFPMLSVNSIEDSAKWYVDVLQFKHVFTMPGPGQEPAMVHVRWAKFADLLLVNDSSPSGQGSKGIGVTLNFAMGDQCIDEFSDKLRELDCDEFVGPIDQPWNARELVVIDPDGYRLNFTQPINKDLSLDVVVDKFQQSKKRDE